MRNLTIESVRPPVVHPEWQLIAFLWFAYLLNQADRQVVYTLFPALQKTLGLSDAVLGLTGALFLWVYGAFSPIAGILGDRLSRTALVVGSLLLWSLLTVLSGLAPNGMALLGCRGLLGVSESFFMPAAYGLMAAAHGVQTRSRAIAVFGTSQLVGVAIGGSVSAFIAEKFDWRVSFLLLGGIGMLFALPLSRFFQRMPENFSRIDSRSAADLKSFFQLLKIPTVQIVAFAIAVATFGLYLVYTWLTTFLYDKFHIGLARAGFEASVYPQIGTAAGLLIGGWLADRFNTRIAASRFWVILVALFCGAPCMFSLAWTGALPETRLAAIGVGFFAGFVAANQAAATFDVVPPELRSSAIGVLNLVGAFVSGFAPFLGGLARRTIGVDRLMTFTAGLYVLTGLVLLYGILRHFQNDRIED
jgi:predicted MFS family arabinose efflux permease